MQDSEVQKEATEIEDLESSEEEEMKKEALKEDPMEILSVEKNVEEEQSELEKD